MSQKRLATLQAQNAALKAELANLQSLDEARTQAAAQASQAAAHLPAVIGGQQSAAAASSADAAELAAAQSEDKVRNYLELVVLHFAFHVLIAG